MNLSSRTPVHYAELDLRQEFEDNSAITIAGTSIGWRSFFYGSHCRRDYQVLIVTDIHGVIERLKRMCSVPIREMNWSSGLMSSLCRDQDHLELTVVVERICLLLR